MAPSGVAASNPWPPDRSQKSTCHRSAVVVHETGLLIPAPVRLATADLVDAEHRDRLRLGRSHPGGVSGERVGDDRPGDAVIAGRLHDRAAAVGDCRPRRLPQPHGQPGTSRDLRNLLGDGLTRTGRRRAVPASFTPAQPHRPPGDRQVLQPGRGPLFHPSSPLPALRAASCLFTTGGQVHHRDARSRPVRLARPPGPSSSSSRVVSLTVLAALHL